MQPTFNHLSDIMLKQKEIYETLYALSKQKQKELISGSIDSLAGITKQEEVLIHRVGLLESNRYACACQLNAKYGLDEDTSLSEALNVIPQEERSRFDKIMSEMSELLNKMDIINKENQALIEHSLQYVNFTIDTVSRVNDHTTYGNTNEIKQESLRNILDEKV